MPDADHEDALRLLPHRPPFLFVTRVLSRSPGAVRAAWDLTGQEDFFEGHFPADPIVPGVLVAEALAQTAGLAVPDADIPEGTRSRGGSLARVSLKFLQPARPPATVELTATHTGSLGTLHQFDVMAAVNGRPIARGELAISVAAPV